MKTSQHTALPIKNRTYMDNVNLLIDLCPENANEELFLELCYKCDVTLGDIIRYFEEKDKGTK